MMLNLAVEPDKSEPISGTVNGTFKEVFDKRKLLKKYPDIGMYVGVSITNNSVNEMGINFGAPEDSEKVDTISPSGTLVRTSCPNKIFLKNFGIGDASYIIYFDYYSKELLNELNQYYIETLSDAIALGITKAKAEPKEKEKLSLAEKLFELIQKRIRGGK